MKGKRIISLVISVFMLMTFIPFQAMAITELIAIVTFGNDSHANEYAIMDGETVIESGDQVLIGTELKIVPTEVAPEGYAINGFWLNSYDGTDEIFDKIEGDSFIVTKDLEVYDVELSFVISENDGDIWVRGNEFYIWDSLDVDGSERIDSYDFLEFYNSDDFSLEPHTMDYHHTITSKGTAINKNIYVVDSDYYGEYYPGLYFGDLNLGAGGVYGYSYDREGNEGQYTYYPDIYLEKGKLAVNNIYSEERYDWGGYIWVDESMNLFVKEDIVCDYIESYGGTIVVDGDIIAPDVYFDSDDGPLYVTVGGNINTKIFGHGGGYVHVKNNIIADYNEELFGMDFDDYGQPYINVRNNYADFNPTQLIVDGDIKTGETGHINIGDEEDYYGPFMMNSLNMENESENKPRKNKDNDSNNNMMLTFVDEEKIDTFVEVYTGGNIEAGRDIYINNGTVIAEGSIKTTNEESYKTIYIYGGNVECNEMHSATGIRIFDNPMGTSVDVTGDMTAKHSIYMFRNPYLYGDEYYEYDNYEYDYNTPGFIEVNVGGVIKSDEHIIIGRESFMKKILINNVPMFIDVNAGGIESGDNISVFGSNLFEDEYAKEYSTEMIMPFINQYTININVDGNMTASNMIELIYSDIYVSGSINKTGIVTEEDYYVEGLLAIGGSIVRCGSMSSETEIVVAYIDTDLESLLVVEGNITAENILLENGKIYAHGISAKDIGFIILDGATLFDANNENEIIIPNNESDDLYRTTFSGLVPNATVKIEIDNEKYTDSVKIFTTDADKDGNIYVWLLGDETVGTAYYGLGTLVTSPTAISTDGTEIEFKPLDAKLATISMDIPDTIFNPDTGNPWSDFEEDPLDPSNWIFEYDGDTMEGFSEDIGDYNLVFTRNGQLYDISNIGGFLAGEYKVTVSIEHEIEGETYIAVGVDEFTIEPWVITIEADNKKLLKGSEIDEDFFTISYNDNIGLSEELDFEEIFGGFKVICDGNTENVGTYPIYVKPLSINDFIRFKFMMKVMFVNSAQLILKDGTFRVYEESPEEPPTRPSTTYYTITASVGEGGDISPKGSVRVARRSDKTFKITADEGYVIKDVLVNGESIGKVNSYTFENITKHATIEALFSPVEPEEWENPFEDVNEDDWFYKAVEFCVKKGIFTGMTENSFQPDTHVTRAMFVTILGRLYGINIADYKTKVFDDVDLGQWYSPYVQWALENEIVKGYSEKTFGPNDKITREQMCSIIVRYCEYAKIELKGLIDEVKFEDDAMISSWAKEYVKESQMANLIQGIGNNRFNPLGNASRAEAAIILMRLIQNVIE